MFLCVSEEISETRMDVHDVLALSEDEFTRWLAAQEYREAGFQTYARAVQDGLAEDSSVLHRIRWWRDTYVSTLSVSSAAAFCHSARNTGHAGESPP